MEAKPLGAQQSWPATAPLTVLPGVGERTAERLRAAGFSTLADLLSFFPRRCRDLVEIDIPSAEHLGSLVRLRGRVRGTRAAWLPGRRSMVTLDLAAADGTPFEAPFFNQPWLRRAWAPGSERTLEGVLDVRGRKFMLRHARVLGDGSAVEGPVQLRYPEVEGFSPARLQRWIGLCLERLDWRTVRLPRVPPVEGVLGKEENDPRSLYRGMHRPASREEHEAARRTFAVLEATALFGEIERRRRARAARPGFRIAVDDATERRILARIPFELSPGQREAVRELRRLLAGPSPMGALLQGDVGSGKTAVAVYGALAAIARGAQAAFLAPTELLAEQHHAEVSRWLAGSDLRIALVTASMTAAERRQVRADIAGGRAHLVFGTHALLSEGTSFASLGLVIVDELHRFGVEQRMALVRKGRDPHVLVMSATPIPRTLALSLFGDLDCIALREPPPGRRPVRAFRVEPRNWRRALCSIARAVRRAGLVYVVCPAIGEDGERQGAVLVHEQLSRRFRCGLVHGRMPAAERQRVIEAFRRRDFDVLVGTTVLEVGVDVPDAVLMVVVGADRFGIASLHQLRGRVGRGRRRGLCLLAGAAGPRVRAVCESTDGFALAERDLALRGSGELLGAAQSGRIDFRALDPVEDRELLGSVREAVRAGFEGAGAFRTRSGP
ncbi:MAG: ATP-dependent DNA helicase RecG [Planctomycetota bacterium]